MSDKQHELVQRYINTREYLTIKIYDCYLLFHRNIVQHSASRELGLELPPAIVQRIFGSNPLSVVDVTSTRHVDPSLYDIIIFADKSAVYTRTKLSLTNRGRTEAARRRRLPYYVQEDLELLRCCGMSEEDIDLFVRKLADNSRCDMFASSDYDQVLQKIIDYSDISTRLSCRLVSRKWQAFVDRSSAWNCVFLTKLGCCHVDRALSYFQKIDIRELDLSQSILHPLSCDTTIQLPLQSLRSLCISVDHPPELFALLCQTAPFLQYIKLIQTVNSLLKIPTTQLYDCVRFVTCLCQNNLKCLRRLHIQLRSASDQMFLESSSATSIPISYELITC